MLRIPVCKFSSLSLCVMSVILVSLVRSVSLVSLKLTDKLTGKTDWCQFYEMALQAGLQGKLTKLTLLDRKWSVRE